MLVIQIYVEDLFLYDILSLTLIINSFPTFYVFFLIYSNLSLILIFYFYFLDGSRCVATCSSWVRPGNWHRFLNFVSI